MTTTVEQLPALASDPSVRATYLGSSDSPPVLGCGFSGENQHTVWSRKVGLLPEMEDNEQLLCGRVLQPAICELLRLKTGYDVRPHDETRQLHHELSWLGATPDSFIHGDPRGLGIGELKNVGQYNAAEWKGIEPPLRVAVQVQHQMLVTGATWGISAGLIGGNKLVYFEFGLHSRLIDAMLPALRTFWGYVESRTPPPVDGSEGCSESLKRLYPNDNGKSVSLPVDACGWFDELTALKRFEKRIAERRMAIENLVKSAIGESSVGVLPDGRQFTWKQQTSNYPAREAYSSTFRVLRQSTKKQTVALPETKRIERFSNCTAALLAMGASLRHESDSGSRYFELAGGLQVRVSDHEPNEKTAAWIGRNEVAEIRVDSDAWQDQLTAITGPQNESE